MRARGGGRSEMVRGKGKRRGVGVDERRRKGLRLRCTSGATA